MAEETQTVVERVEAMFSPEVEEPVETPVEEPTAEEETKEVVEVEPEVETEVEVDEPTDETEYVEIEVDGDLIQVEAKYKDHFLRQQDYTEKTQKISAQRKEIEVQLGAIEQTRQQFNFAQAVQPDILKAQQLEVQADQYHEHLRENIDNLSSTDITKLQMAITDARSERDKIVSGLQQKQGEFQQAQEYSHGELLTKGTEVLRSRIPGWDESHQEQVRKYALKSGYTEAELQGVLDPRQVETLWKASRYDALKSGAVPAVKKVQAAPKIKAKARDPKTGKFVAQKNLQKQLKDPKLSDKDKARLIRAEMAERFG